MKILKIMCTLLFTSVLFAQTPDTKKIYYGKILEIKKVMGYDYLRVNEDGVQLWVAITQTPVQIGEIIGYDKITVMHDFKSKTLDKTFKEIIFVNDLYLPKESTKHFTMKSALLSSPPKQQIVQEVRVNKYFVKKPFYTVQEVHDFAKELQNQTISVKATVLKVSRKIMQRDWIHLKDGTGDESANTNDFVVTAENTSVKKGDVVVATGKISINKDFGYGYFYPVIMDSATFKTKYTESR